MARPPNLVQKELCEQRTTVALKNSVITSDQFDIQGKPVRSKTGAIHHIWPLNTQNVTSLN